MMITVAKYVTKMGLTWLICFMLFKCMEPKCEFVSIKTLFTDVSIHVGVDTFFVHYILLKEFSKECLDSATVLNIAKGYIDTSKYNLPIGIIKIFNSNIHLKNKSEVDWNKANKDCLVSIWIDEATRKPENFIFYNYEGKIIYEGKRWLKYR